MEKEIKIKTKDKHIIYGVLNTTKKKSKSLIVFVHGLTGHKNEHHFYNSAKFFPKNGFDTFRFDLYSGEKGGRSLMKSAISTHTKDVETVVNHFNKKYKHIFLVGHSLGGPSIMLSKVRNDISGIILWDSSARTKVEWDDFKYNKTLKTYMVSWGTEYLISKKMVDEWKTLPLPKNLISDIKTPIKIICAGKGALIKSGKEYYKYAKGPKSFSVIKGAGHVFDEYGKEDELFKETLNFIKKLSK